MRLPTASLTAVVVLAATTVPATAQTVAPPGNAGVDQYFEVVPEARGETRPAERRGVLPAAARRALSGQGAAGRRVQRVVEATAPQLRVRRPARRGTPVRAPRREPAPRPDSTFTSAIRSIGGAADEGGMGLALPAVLAASTIGLLAVALTRRRRA